MNCQSFEEIVNELARDPASDQLEKSETSRRERALVHANECPACALRLQDERALSRCLNEMASEMKSLTAAARVEGELLRAFRETLRSRRTAVGGQKSEVRSQIPDSRFQIPDSRFQKSDSRFQIPEITRFQGSKVARGWNRWLVATAAVLLIVFGIGGLWRYMDRQSPVTGRSENTPATTSAVPARSDVKGGPGSSPSKPGKESTGNMENIFRRTNPHPRRTRPFNRNGNASRQDLATTKTSTANDAESEVATQFMPLGYSGPINLQDGGQLVRVELPRSAMWDLGLPVNMDRYSERVKADVFVGVDGLARAIRFVQ